MGTLAGPRLRKLRGLAHQAFDPLWQDGGRVIDRAMAYRIASEVMGVNDLHIANLDEAGCWRLIERIGAISFALDRHATLLTEPRPQPVVDASTRELLDALFGPEAHSPLGMSLPLPEVRRYGLPLQDLLLAGVLRTEQGSDSCERVSLTPLGVNVLKQGTWFSDG